MKDSPLISKAKALIESGKGKKSSSEQRKEKAVILAGMMLDEARLTRTPEEIKQQAQLAGIVKHPSGKVFTTALTDQCFRSSRPDRIADQLVYVIKSLGVPRYIPAVKSLALRLFTKIGRLFSAVSVPLTIEMIRRETRHVILPGEEKPLIRHMQKRRAEGVRINLNHLGEAILGEEEAQNRLNIYLKDLERPEVEYISVKISTIYSQINLLAWEETLTILAERLRLLYRAGINNRYLLPDGTSIAKFVNLDMEEYRDLRLTVALFRKVLDEPEFYRYEAGIVLQSYLPDSYLIQQELTVWAMQRMTRGGAPIKIRIVKGANLAMEQFESAVRLWPQAPYETKGEVDANYKRMVSYGCRKEHATAVRLGIASHNLFDIAYALLLRAENETENEVCFEMLEGMADHMRRVVQALSGDMLLYCPAATKEEFQNAVAYLVRRLDENTAPENFLKQAFDLTSSGPEWTNQVERFSEACDRSEQVSYLPRRTQNRLSETFSSSIPENFCNEPDTDWTLPQNIRWAEKILNDRRSATVLPLPLVIDGETIPPEGKFGIGEDPSYPGLMMYQYSLADKEQVDRAVLAAKKEQARWGKLPVEERCRLLQEVAKELRAHRGELIGAMVADAGKTIVEADNEISEAIDFADYYARNMLEWDRVTDVAMRPKGTVLVTSPWNFPCSIPVGGISAALVTGNCVIFKPPAEAVLVGWILAQIFWKAGIGKKALQFITCEDDPVGSYLIKNPEISAVVLTGATETAKLFLKMRPGLDLMAETGGKNAMVITGLADRDLAVKDLVQSAFGHSGQKCSACSLAILEAEVYDDPHFLANLKDAAGSLAVGLAADPKTKINPLIGSPSPALLRGLTVLEEGETWLLKPEQNSENPYLWSPGIKLGVKPSSFTFQNELFGPVLGLVRAENPEHAFQLMNMTAYGLTAGIHSLDEREQDAWLKEIEAGNCYINRTITGAIVERQPFGGCKNSSFGKGYKAGGPNYLLQLMQAEQVELPGEKAAPCPAVSALSKALEHSPLLDIDPVNWKASIESDAFYLNNYFASPHDPMLVRGQDNLQCYVPHKNVVLRGMHSDSPDDLIRVIAAAIAAGVELDVSLEDQATVSALESLGLPRTIRPIRESNEAFIKRLLDGKRKRVRLLSQPSTEVQAALAEAACPVNIAPALINGRIELLHLLREVSISRDYHRYGNLGIRENEPRHPLPGSSDCIDPSSCDVCECHD